MKTWEFAAPDGEPLDFWIANAYEILNRYTGDGETFIDLGAHVGIVSVLAVKEKGFKKVIAVEPALENYVLLLDNIAVNDCEGYILPLWAAVTNTPDLTKLDLRFLPRSNSGTFSLNLAPDLPSQSVMGLTMETIYAILGWIPDFLKVDIEGEECAILRDINSKYLDIEVHPELGCTMEEAEEILGKKYDLKKGSINNGLYGFKK